MVLALAGLSSLFSLLLSAPFSEDERPERGTEGSARLLPFLDFAGRADGLTGDVFRALAGRTTVTTPARPGRSTDAKPDGG